MMKVCYFGTYRKTYKRNQIMIAGLRMAGVEVLECQASLWRGIEDRVSVAQGKWFSFDFVYRLGRAYLQLIWMYLRCPEHDVVVLGYPGQLDVFLARILTWMRRKPLVLDVLMSLHLIAVERNLDRGSPRSIDLLRRLEWAALRIPDHLIQDTPAYVAWLGNAYGLRAERFSLVPLGAEERIFQPLPVRPPDGVLRVVYYGTFTPNHRVAYILEAARLVRDDPGYQFDLIGEGPDLALAAAFIEKEGLQARVRLVGWLSQEELAAHMQQADVCLGAFGSTPQSLMTVHNKIYEGMAMRRVVVTGASPAVEAQFVSGIDLLTCDRQNPASLVEVLDRLRQNPSLAEQIARQGYEKFLDAVLHPAGWRAHAAAS